MKRFWQICLAIVSITAHCGVAQAQQYQPSEIGSYQSILARAGYGHDSNTELREGFTTNRETPKTGVADPVIPPPPGALASGGSGVSMNHDVLNGSGCSAPGCSECSTTADCDCCDSCGTHSCRSKLKKGRTRKRAGKGRKQRCACGRKLGSDQCSCIGSYIESGSDYHGSTAPVFSPENSASCGLVNEVGCASGDCGSAKKKANTVFGIFGLAMWRDYEDNFRMGYNGTTDLYSNDVDHGNMNGVGLSLARRRCGGFGWESIYWTIDEESDVVLAAPSSTYLTGLSAINYAPGGGTVADFFTASEGAQLLRDTDINNFEFNLLRDGGQYTTRFCRSAKYELFGGFRLFTFDESLRYVALCPCQTLEYGLEAENSLAGFQLGGRNEICLSRRIRFACLGSAGVYNNYVETNHQIIDSNGFSALECADTKNDGAFLGQIDLGLIYQFSKRSRANIGYRALGVSGVALATNQIPYDFTDSRDMATANSNGGLLLHGFYYGGEFCF